MPDLILEDKDRSKLDGIVSQMVANKESDDAIHFVVNDFKNKYGKQKTNYPSQSNLLSAGGNVKPEGTIKPQQQQPQSMSDYLLGKSTRTQEPLNKAGVPIAVKVGADTSPDIGEAIDNAVIERNKNFGVDKPDMNFGRKEIEKAYKNGDLVLVKGNKERSVLKKSTGFLRSAIDAINQSAVDRADNENLAAMSTEDKVKYLKAKELDEKDTAPSKYLGAAGQFVGENADMLEKGALGAMTGGAAAPSMIGASNFGSFLALANDFAKGGYSNTLQKTYYDLKQQNPHMSDIDAMKQAEKAAPVGEATGLATGAILSGIPKVPVGSETVAASKGLLKGIVKSAGKVMSLEAPKMGAVSAGEGIVNDAAEQAVGVHKKVKDYVNDAGDNFAHGAAIGTAFWITLHPAKALSYLRPQAENTLASLPKDQRFEMYQKAQEQGLVTSDDIAATEAKISRFEQAKAPYVALPIPEEKKAAMAGKQVQLSKASTPEEAATINNEIKDIYEAKSPFDVERDNVTGEKASTKPVVIMPDEINRPEVTTIGGEEPTPEEKTAGAKIILPENNTKPNVIEPIQPESKASQEGENKAEENILRESEPVRQEEKVNDQPENNGATGEASSTVSSNATLSEGQVHQSGVQESVDGTGRGNAEAAPTLLDEKTKPNNNVKDGQTETQAEGREDVLKNDNNGAGNAAPPVESGKVTAGSGENKIGISHYRFDKIGEELGLPVYEKDPTTREAQVAEADKRLANGEMGDVIKKMEKGDMPLDHEQIMVAKYVAGLKHEYDIKPSDDILRELKHVKELSDKVGGRLVGRSLEARKFTTGIHPLEGGRASAMVAKMEANGVDTLTEQQKAEVDGLLEKYKNLAETEKAKREEIEKKYNEFLAGKEIEKQKPKANTKKSKEDFKKERENIVNSIKDKWKKAGNDGTLNALPVPYAKQLVAIAPDVAKLVKSLVEEGIDKLEDVIKNVHETVKGAIPEITENDVRDIIAGVHNEKKETRNELAEKMYNLRKEAKLLGELETVMNRIKQPKTEKQKIKDNQRIADLKKQIQTFKENDPFWNFERDYKKMETERNRQLQRVADLKKKIADTKAGLPKEVKVKKVDTPEIEALKKELAEAEKSAREALKPPAEVTKLQNIIKANERTAAKYKERIDKGDFENKKRTSWVDDLDFKMKVGKLYDEAIATSVAKQDAKYEFDMALLKDQEAKRNFAQKVMPFLKKLAGTTQALAAGIDDSFMFVQAGFTLMANPRTAVKITMKDGKLNVRGAIVDHVLDAASEKRFKAQIEKLHKSEYWPIISGSGLDVLEPQSLIANMKEEMFAHNFLDKIGTKKANLGHFAKIFERAYTSLGNNIRVDLFLKRADQLIAEGKTFENNRQEFEDAAKVINNLTGRGSMHPNIAKATNLMTPIIWSPKMIASSINLLGLSDAGIVLGQKGFYAKLTPSARKFAAAQMTRGISIAAGIMAAAAFGGAKVDSDVRSVTFGDIQVGEKSYNVFGRYASMMRLVMQMVIGRKSTSGKVEDVGEAGGKTRGQLGGSFLRGKMTPISGVAFDYLANDKKDFFTKKPITAKSALIQTTAPMSFRNIADGLRKDGTATLLNDFLPNFVGISVKDQRDFYANPYSGTKLGDFFEKNKLRISEPTVIQQKDSKHPDGQLSDDEKDKILAEREIKLKHLLEKAVNEGIVSEKKTQEQNQAKIKWIEGQALDLAKEKVLGQKEKKTPEERREAQLNRRENKLFLRGEN
jgi:hypothetical protein